MPAATNVQKAADFAKVTAIDFVESFHENIDVLLDTLGLTRKIEKKPGQVLKTYKVVGELEDGEVGEGEDIPLSHFKTEVADIFEVTYKKFRKRTTFEAIAERGYKQAVLDTDGEMLIQVQGGLRKNFFSFVKTGLGTAQGNGLRDTMAQVRAQLIIRTEDYGVSDSDFIYFLNPLDTADYIGSESNLTVQDAYGMTYIQGFLGLYNVIERTDIEPGTVVATTKNNLILYYINVRNTDIAEVFDFNADETGYIGMARNVHYTNLTTDTVVVTATGFYAELLDWVIIADINPYDGGEEGDVQESATPQVQSVEEEKDILDMTAKELKAYAAEHGIDISAAKRKEEILDAIIDAEDAGNLDNADGDDQEE